MSLATNDGPQDTFWKRNGGAALCIGVMTAVQILLVVTVLYFTGSRTEPDRNAASAPTLNRP